MVKIPDAILHAVRSDDDRAFDELVTDQNCCFLVDWRADDLDTVADCEAILQTDTLTAEYSDDGEEMFIVFDQKRVEVPLTMSTADRHITLLSLNDALSPHFEVRMLYASVGSDTGTFVPLSREAWSALEQMAPETVTRRFHVLKTHPNTFTELVRVPRKPRNRPWWRFWGGR